MTTPSLEHRLMEKASKDPDVAKCLERLGEQGRDITELHKALKTALCWGLDYASVLECGNNDYEEGTRIRRKVSRLRKLIPKGE